MANRNIDESIRKPRRTKGTPFYFQRNLYSLAIIALGGVSWYLYELWPETQKLKRSLKEGKLQYSPEVQQHILSMRLGVKDPALESVLQRLRQKEQSQREQDEGKPQPWYSKVFSPST